MILASHGIIASAGGIDPDAQAFFDRVTIAGGTLTTTEKNATNQLVLDMKSAGIWTAMKAVYPMVGASVNLLSYSNTFSNSAWTKSGGTILSTNNLDPNGGYTASRIDLPIASVSQIYNLISTAANTYTSSMWIRLVSGSGAFQFGFYDGTSFLTNAITVTSTWQRFSVAKTNSSSSSTRGCWLYSNDPNQVIEVYGGQVELGSIATTYAPVSGSRTAEAIAACAQNLKSSSFTGTFNGGWTFASTGATPNGSNAFCDTNLPNNTMSQNSMSMCTYLRTDVTQTLGDLGVWSGGFGSIIYSRNGLGNYAGINNSTSANVVNFSVPNSLGFFLNKRTSSTQIILQRNYTQTLLNSNSENLLTSNFIIARTGNFGGEYSTRETAFVSIGDGITDTQASNFYTAVQSFQTTLGRQV